MVQQFVKLYWVLVVSLTIGLVGAVSAQSGDMVEIEQVQELVELIAPDAGPTPFRSAIIAPDGSKIAWYAANEDAWCVYTFSAAEITCYPHTEAFRGQPIYPVWSPDSNRIVYTESLFVHFFESDIWVFDTTTGDITNWTDDGADEVPFIREVEGPQPKLDYSPIWHPLSGDLYFFRTEDLEIFGLEVRTLVLMRLNDEMVANGDEPELVTDLTEALPLFSVYSQDFQGHLSAPAAISPDGTLMALRVLGSDREDERDGIWVIDLNEPARPQQLTGSLFSAGLPQWIEPGVMRIDGLTWTADGQRIIVALRVDDMSTAGLWSMYYTIDADTGATEPLFDYEALPGQADVFAEEPFAGFTGDFAGLASHQTMAIYTASTASHESLLLLNPVQFQERGFMLIDITGEEPALQDYVAQDELDVIPMNYVSASADGKILIGGYLVTLR